MGRWPQESGGSDLSRATRWIWERTGREHNYEEACTRAGEQRIAMEHAADRVRQHEMGKGRGEERTVFLLSGHGHIGGRDGGLTSSLVARREWAPGQALAATCVNCRRGCIGRVCRVSRHQAQIVQREAEADGGHMLERGEGAGRASLMMRTAGVEACS